jgi:hypothetical protein
MQHAIIRKPDRWRFAIAGKTMSHMFAASVGIAASAPLAAHAVDINRSAPTLQAATEATMLGRS